VTLCKIVALVQDWCNRAKLPKSCNSATLAGMFLFVRSDGGAENAGRENDGREIDGPICRA